jgi:mannosyl-3-phosphoglycerate phosphatase
MSTPIQWLVVTDLDATLLDESYYWDAALPALQRLRDLSIPLILNSSKTLSEMSELATALGTMAPVVSDNGGGVSVHKDSGLMDPNHVVVRSGDYLTEVNGLSRDFIIGVAHALRAEEGYQFQGFSDWSLEQVIGHTGLSDSMAQRSLSRYATEPIVWEDSSERYNTFTDSLAKAGIRVLRGGRFLHLMGEVDKADGLVCARALYEKQQPKVDWKTIAVGDSANDVAMLEAADIALVIPHADGPHILPKAPRVVHASRPATKGWNDTILTLLTELS